MSRTRAVVIENFGIEVLNCNEALAEKNNAVARATFGRKKRQAEICQATSPAHNTAQPRTPGRSGAQTRQSAANAPIVDPAPGKIYLALWGKSRKSWAVLVLPRTKLNSVGVPATLSSLGLTEKVPACYNFDRRTNVLTWAKGYEEDGALVAKREFPVMYFDGPTFPAKRTVSWLGAKDLQPFDLEVAAASNTPHIKLVRKYLQGREKETSVDNSPDEVQDEFEEASESEEDDDAEDDAEDEAENEAENEADDEAHVVDSSDGKSSSIPLL